MQRWELLEDSIFEQRCELAQIRCDIFRDGSHNSSYGEKRTVRASGEYEGALAEQAERLQGDPIGGRRAREPE